MKPLRLQNLKLPNTTQKDILLFSFKKTLLELLKKTSTKRHDIHFSCFCRYICHRKKIAMTLFKPVILDSTMGSCGRVVQDK